ncbi:TPA: hypothetical protein HA231_03960 [Candidatus Woesearchaeota archaeon]|nr:hypothetical protein [Candidatus Woesearchaeota archaeon]
MGIDGRIAGMVKSAGETLSTLVAKHWVCLSIGLGTSPLVSGGAARIFNLGNPIDVMLYTAGYETVGLSAAATALVMGTFAYAGWQKCKSRNRQTSQQGEGYGAQVAKIGGETGTGSEYSQASGLEPKR